MVRPVPLHVPMSDGVTISALRFPAPRSPAPAVVVMTPYRKERMATGALWPLLHDAGYDVLIADIRGFGGSRWERYAGIGSEREIQDGVEFLEWVAAAGFCDGQTATGGGSYHGYNQLLFAARRPQGLRCIAPLVSPVDTYRDWTNQGGIPSDTKWPALAYPDCGQQTTMRRGTAMFTDMLADLDNDGHHARSPEYVLDQVRVPALCIGGWYDFFLRGTLRAFRGARGPKRLVIGPWGHSGFEQTHRRELVRWYEHWLSGEGDDPALDAPVRLWDRAAGRWHERDTWPETGELDWHVVRPITRPTAVAVAPTIAAYPQQPPDGVPIEEYLSHLGSGFDSHWWGEGASFDAGPLGADRFLLGPVGLTVWLDSDRCRELDVYARIAVIRADGSTLRLSEGRLRATHRSVDLGRSELAQDGTVIVPWHRHHTSEPLPTREPVPLSIEMEPLCAHLAAADRVILALSIARHDGTDTAETATVLPATTIHLPHS